MLNFKTYKTQYAEASAQVEELKKQLEEANKQITELQSKVTVDQISKEDYEKLVMEHAEYAKKNDELISTIKKMEAEKVDVETLAAKQAQAILAGVGVEKPIVAKTEDTAEEDENGVFTLDGVKYRVFNR